ncbi:type II toxin-antitoxin system CcdA family antitoxin [Microbacterium sp.]|uniref:type II toxin-antitoxin system CcdA family antitoxin n=1 Tax=Microbacterium sp. TaxID=51671 RepID=UPI003A8EA808
MPKISIYVPDRLYDEVRRKGIPLSAVAQRAFEEAVHAGRNEAWIASARTRAPRVSGVIDTAAVLDGVRDEFGA